MNKDEQAYLDLLKDILNNGDVRNDRTGVGTISKFGTTLRFSLENDIIPVLTTKKVFVRGVIEELLFFIRGETDTKKLEAKGVNIWKGNTSREFLDSRGLTSYEEGNMGPMYGNQWRNFNGHIPGQVGVDQLKNALNLIKNNPDSRRIMVTAYNPSASSYSVLDPCHMFFQFYVSNGNLSLQWMQRSVDCGAGLPFNILSYAILTHLFAKATGLKAKELIFFGGDTHIYTNHVNQLTDQINREPFDFPTFNITKNISSIEDMEALTFENFSVENYTHHPALKLPMAV
jgi:thymidylate synthase